MVLFTTILVVLSISALLAVIKYINNTTRTLHTTNSAVLIDMINTMKYKKDVMGNDYPVYSGKLEKEDTEEYIAFLNAGILGVVSREGNI